MADSVQSTQTQPEIEGQAGGGLIAALNTYIPQAVAAANAPRAAGYQDLLNAAQEFRIALNNLDPQADAAVLTAVAACLGTI